MSDEEKQYRLDHDMPLLDTRGQTIAGVCVGGEKDDKDDYDSVEGLLRRVRSLESSHRPKPIQGLFGLYF
jgi:hypothetical protein